MKAGVVSRLAMPTSTAGKKSLFRLGCALLAVGACIGVVRLSTASGVARATALLRASTDAERTLPPPSPSDGAAAAAYARQRASGDHLLHSMRAAPDAWGPNMRHRSGGMWVDPFRGFYQCPGVVEKVGAMSDGGKWVCGVDTLLQRPGCVIYSFGSNGDTSFEQALLKSSACTVWTFDPTLNAARLAKVKAVPGLHFAPVGLADVDGEKTIAGKVLPVRTLATLMRERGHAWVDLLKMDIEGAEWPVLNAYINASAPLPVTQAQIEFHARNPNSAIETMAGLLGLGMRVFHSEENNYCGPACAGRLYELALANVDAEGRLVTGP